MHWTLGNCLWSSCWVSWYPFAKLHSPQGGEFSCKVVYHRHRVPVLCLQKEEFLLYHQYSYRWEIIKDQERALGYTWCNWNSFRFLSANYNFLVPSCEIVSTIGLMCSLQSFWTSSVLYVVWNQMLSLSKNTEQSSLPASSSLSQSYVVISRAVAVQYFSQIGNTVEC